MHVIRDLQMEVNKKREAELQRLRRELEETCVQSEVLAASLKKRHSDAMAELSEQYEALQRTRAKLEKEKQSLRMEVDELTASLESLQKAKVSMSGCMLCKWKMTPFYHHNVLFNICNGELLLYCRHLQKAR